MGLVSVIKSAAGEVLGNIPGVDTVGRVLGVSDTKGDTLAEDAAVAMGQSNQNAQTAYDLAMQQAAAAGLIQAPSLVSATGVGVPTIAAGIADQYGTTNTTDPRVGAYNAQAQRYDAALAEALSATNRMAGYDAALARTVDAIPAGSAGLGDVDTSVTMPTVGPAALTSRVKVNDAYIGDLATDARLESLAAARDIRTAPLSAQAQFASSMDKATAEALAVASQARGNERAGARREALIQMALKGGASGEAAAATAAQENAARLTAYSSALQGVRGADVTTAQTQAEIDARLVQTQAELDAAVAQGNTQAINDLAKQKAALDLQAQTTSVQAGLQQQAAKAGISTANMQARNAVSLANAQNATSVELANAAARTKAAQDLAAAQNLSAQQFAAAQTGVNQTNAAATTQSSADYAKTANEMAAQYAAAATKASETNATLAAQRAEGNAARATTIATSDAQNKTSAGIAQGQALLAAGQSNASNALDASKTNVNAYLDTEKLKQAGVTSGVQGMNTAASVQGTNAGSVVKAQAAEAEAQAKQDAGLIGGVTSMVGSLTSDRAAKTGIEQPSDAEIDDLAEHLRAYTWRYKPEFAEKYGNGVRGGVMAQDVEKSKLGKKFVSEDENGVKEVDVLSLAGLLAAAAARSVRKNKERRTRE